MIHPAVPTHLAALALVAATACSSAPQQQSGDATELVDPAAKFPLPPPTLPTAGCVERAAALSSGTYLLAQYLSFEYASTCEDEGVLCRAVDYARQYARAHGVSFDESSVGEAPVMDDEGRALGTLVDVVGGAEQALTLAFDAEGELVLGQLLSSDGQAAWQVAAQDWYCDTIGGTPMADPPDASCVAMALLDGPHHQDGVLSEGTAIAPEYLPPLLQPVALYYAQAMDLEPWQLELGFALFDDDAGRLDVAIETYQTSIWAASTGGQPYMLLQRVDERTSFVCAYAE